MPPLSLSCLHVCLVSKTACIKQSKPLQGRATEAMCFHARLPEDYEKQVLILLNSKI